MTTKNSAYTEQYGKIRKSIEKSFEEKSLKQDTMKEYISPSQKYKLITINLDNGKKYWDYVKGTVYNNETGEELFVILRNYGIFMFQWIEHQNGKEYLLCGEDYQGYVCLNLTDKKKYVYFPEDGFDGCGFCWVEIDEYDKKYNTSIKVEGCYWAYPFEVVEYDFSNPDELPYKEINRHDIDNEEDNED